MNGKLDHSQVWRASMKLMAATVFAVISVSAWGDRQAKASGAAPDVLASLSLAIGNYKALNTVVGDPKVVARFVLEGKNQDCGSFDLAGINQGSIALATPSVTASTRLRPTNAVWSGVD